MSEHKSSSRAVFIDRDGTINEEVHYLSSLEDLSFIQGAKQGIKLLNSSGYRVIVITNQSGVARGLFPESFIDEVHDEIRKRLASQGARVDALYYCPHHPSEGSGPYRRECRCRKPLPGMIEQAVLDFHIDIEESFLIGDGLVDLRLALNTGLRPVLVRTGHGTDTFARLSPEEKAGLAYDAYDLLDACRWICSHAEITRL
ncbi:MAG TPA: HAD family hydrolase [Thermodesulfobacteriaceae bacterium]|nr:HAD family hydrolase [Thermodesulfobacteriaceae bacterium]